MEIFYSERNLIQVLRVAQGGQGKDKEEILHENIGLGKHIF